MKIFVLLPCLLMAGIATARTTLDRAGPLQCENYAKAKCNSISGCKYADGQCRFNDGSFISTSSSTTTVGGALNGPKGPTKPGKKCNKKVTFPKKKSPVSKYPMYTTVFGIGLMGSGISDTKFQYLASILAQMIDNDHDGCPDSPEVVTWLNKENVFQWFGPGSDYLATTKRPDSDAIYKANKTLTMGQAPLYETEINPSCAGTKQTDSCSDASFEEIWHLVTGQGYASAFPKVFAIAPKSKSKLTKAMDVARGGHFTSIPKPYPSKAWYRYTGDGSCNYGCQATEYMFWGMASYLGNHEKVPATIDEFKFNTKKKFMAGDKLMTALIQDTTKYRLPTVSPNGDYRGCSKCATGVSHGGK